MEKTKKTAIYYPLINSIYFYNGKGRIIGGMSGGDLARRKFWRLVKSGVFPRISLSKEVRVTC